MTIKTHLSYMRYDESVKRELCKTKETYIKQKRPLHNKRGPQKRPNDYRDTSVVPEVRLASSSRRTCTSHVRPLCEEATDNFFHKSAHNSIKWLYDWLLRNSTTCTSHVRGGNSQNFSKVSARQYQTPVLLTSEKFHYLHVLCEAPVQGGDLYNFSKVSPQQYTTTVWLTFEKFPPLARAHYYTKWLWSWLSSGGF